MDFAKRQMKNMGWSEGKGLGAEENGIVKPIVPKIQMNTRGLGFSIADSIQVKNQWWAEAYNVASKGLKPEYKITSVGVIVKAKSGLKSEEETGVYNQHFVSGGKIMNDNPDDNELQPNNDGECSKRKRRKKKRKKEEIEDDDVTMIKTDETTADKNCKYSKHSLDFNVIFAKNDNITCHKAARLGIKMSGKMKRLQEQEAKFSSSTTK
ncbi:G patch domain and DexH-box containing protein [Euroglyphus maynei]|uniref:G patch domain-containing protein 4 n=1 Tax=Euroglyphus maynei TaxID=6958 RepID=A0A1Y3AW87_EURMA|nr:G patch domain and DexH-box containing protein [Euroglyphus maynei]